MKIITFNKADTDYYYVTVEEDSIRNKISESKVKKDSVDYCNLVDRTLEFWGVEKCRKYHDWAGTIVIEGELD